MEDRNQEISELEILKKRIGELEDLRREMKQSEEKLAMIVNGLSIPTFVIDQDHKITHWNAALESLSGEKKEDLIGTNRQWIAFYSEERPVMADLIVDGVTDSELNELYGEKYRNSTLIEGAYEATNFFSTFGDEGKWLEFTAAPLRDSDGQIIGAIETLQDITERRQKAEIIKLQAQQILELSTPVIRIWDGVVAAPLIGTLDTMRTQQFMERLLESIVETNSEVALVDITGVPFIDTQIAQHLIDTINAVKLLGAQVVLTGVRPSIAQTLVHLGIDLSDIITRSSMASGLQVALESLNLKIVEMDNANMM